jgi:hypothetical protein
MKKNKENKKLYSTLRKHSISRMNRNTSSVFEKFRQTIDGTWSSNMQRKELNEGLKNWFDSSLFEDEKVQGSVR